MSPMRLPTMRPKMTKYNVIVIADGSSLRPDAQDAHHLAARDGVEGDEPALRVHAAFPFSTRRTNSSSRRLALLRIERTVMPARQRAEQRIEIVFARHFRFERDRVGHRQAHAGHVGQRARRRGEIKHESFHVELGQQRLHRRVLDDAAVVDDRDVAAELLGFFQIMRGQDHRRAGRVDAAHELPHRASDFDVDARGRLVEHEQFRFAHHRAGDHQAPLHAARQRARLVLRLVPELEFLEVFLGALGGDRARNAVETGLVHADVERFLELVEVDFLRHQADQRHRLAAPFADRHTEDARIAARRVDQRGQDADQRRLARAVRPEQGEEVARLHAQRNALERFDAVGVSLSQLGDVERGNRGHGVAREWNRQRLLV
jgi:hypothetical protein